MQCMINVHLNFVHLQCCTIFFLFPLMMWMLMSAPALGRSVEGFVHGRMGMIVVSWCLMAAVHSLLLPKLSTICLLLPKSYHCADQKLNQSTAK